MLKPLLVVGGALVVSFCSWAWAQPWLVRRRHDEYLAGLLVESLEALTLQVKGLLRLSGWGWEKFAATQEILAGDEWTEQRLLDGLTTLHEEVVATDRAAGRSGRDCDQFHFYDCGLGSLREALIQRLAA